MRLTLYQGLLLGFAAVLMAPIALSIEEERPAYTVTADIVFVGLAVIAVSALLGYLIGKDGHD